MESACAKEPIFLEVVLFRNARTVYCFIRAGRTATDEVGYFAIGRPPPAPAADAGGAFERHCKNTNKDERSLKEFLL